MNDSRELFCSLSAAINGDGTGADTHSIRKGDPWNEPDVPVYDQSTPMSHEDEGEVPRT